MSVLPCQRMRLHVRLHSGWDHVRATLPAGFLVLAKLVHMRFLGIRRSSSRASPLDPRHADHCCRPSLLWAGTDSQVRKYAGRGMHLTCTVAR